MKELQNIEMSNGFGDTLFISENPNGTAVIIHDGGKERLFDSFEDAYKQAMKWGYRE